MNADLKVWIDEVMLAPSVDEFRRTLWRVSMSTEAVYLPFTFRDFGRVNVLVSEVEEVLIPLHIVHLIGTVRQPIKRWFGLLSPEKMRVLRLVITCFPDNSLEMDIVEITEIGTSKIRES